MVYPLNIFIYSKVLRFFSKQLEAVSVFVIFEIASKTYDIPEK